MYPNMIFMFDFLFYILSILLGVAFFTLLERKFMSYHHYRKGPNKVSFFGVFQPFSDAIKLLSKEQVNLSFIKIFLYNLGPSIAMICMMFCWIFLDYIYSMNMEILKVLFIIFILSLSFYGMLFMSWGSNSMYSLLGGFRSLAQVISYEVCIIMFMFFPMFFIKSYKINTFVFVQEKLPFFFIFVPVLLSWLIVCLAEANRSPFDISEGESEIVSGFNIEYGGGLFAIIFISEYGMMMFMSCLTIFIFMGLDFFLMKLMLLCFFFIWLRCSFPRVRYDGLMLFSWKYFIMYSGLMLIISV